MHERCRFRARWWTNVSVLHADFCGWNVFRDCDRQAFEDLLREAGFRIEVHREVAMVYGLVLVEHLNGRLTPKEVERLRPRAAG